MTINQNLRDLRQLSGMTQEEVANRVGLTRQVISGYESGRTQPDLDMLEKLAALYGTDISGILYGRSAEQRKLRAVRVAAVVTLAAVLLLTLCRSGLLLFMNTVFPVGELGTMTEAAEQVINVRFALLRASELSGGLAQLFSAAGCLIMGVLLTGLRRLPPARGRALFLLVFAAGSLACALPPAAFDSIYSTADYLLPLLGTATPVVLLAVYVIALCLYRKRRTVK